MNNSLVEKEVKFYLNNLAAFEKRLRAAGGEMVKSRVLEINLRFDSADGTLTTERRVLRLRQDQTALLTYKGPNDPSEGISTRQEIEFQVSNFDRARQFLEALGFVVAANYEKHRTIYQFNGTEIALDELPFGTFCEIEGPSAEVIQQVALKLGLNWEARCLDSYLWIFNRLQAAGKLQARSLTFDELRGVHLTAEEIGLIAADA